MLEDSLFESRHRQKTSKPLTVVVSGVAHVVTVGVLVLIPLLHTHALTLPPIDLSMWAPAVPQPRAVQVVAVQPRVQKYIQLEPNVLTTPAAIPDRIAYVDEPPAGAAGFLPSTPATGIGSLIRDLIAVRETESEAAPPMPPLSPPPAPPRPGDEHKAP